MITMYNPTTAHELFPDDGWTKARASNDNGTGCVEWAWSADGQLLAIRDSNHRDYGTFVFDKDEAAGFIAGVQNGEMNPPA